MENNIVPPESAVNIVDSTATPEKPKQVYRQRNLSEPLDVLTPAQQGVLLKLVRYRYLTVAQFIACGVVKSAATFRNRIIYRLVHRAKNNLVQCQTYFGLPANQRLPYLYALTIHGAAMAADLMEMEPETIRYPIGKITHVNDYRHRELYIDFCIEMDKWADTEDGRNVLSMSHYFDKTGATRNGIPLRSVNRIDLGGNMKPIEPDGIFLVDTGTKRRVLALELNNKTDTKNVVEKLLKYSHAIADNHISKLFHHEKANIVLSVSTTPGATALVRKRIMEMTGFRGVWEPYFIFNDMETIGRDGFGKGWVYADGRDAGEMWR